MSEPTVAELAWLAGIVDGEGCITCWTSPKRRKPHVRFHITNTHWGILTKAKHVLWKITGRHIAIKPKQRADGQRRDSWRIAMYRESDIKKVFQALQPYCEKSAQVSVALEIMGFMRGTPHALSETEYELLHQKAEAVKWFNQNPPHPDPEWGILSEAVLRGTCRDQTAGAC